MSVSNVTLSSNKSFYLVDTRTGPNKVLFLPAASTIQGRYLSIKDYYGGASNSTFTISTTGLDTLDYVGSSYTLNSAFGSLMLLSDGRSSWNFLGFYNGTDSLPPPSWTPFLIPLLTLWLDAADNTTIAFSSGSNITTWTDKSTGLSASNTNGGSQPAYATASQNGKNTVYYDAASSIRWLDIPAFSWGTTSRSCFFVMKNIAGAVNSGSSLGGYPHWFWDRVNGNNPNVWTLIGWTNVRLGGADSTYSFPLNQYVIYELVYSSSTLTQYLTGTQTQSYSTYSSFYDATNGYRLGAINNGDDGYPYPYRWWGNIAEVALFSRALSTSERQQMEGYLAWKWGIQSSLPSGHPYLSTAPLYSQGISATGGSYRFASPIALQALSYFFDATLNPPSSSTWNDIQSNNSITLYNSPTVTTGSPGYVRFNGSSQYGSYFLLNQGNFTTTFWIRTTTTSDSTTFYLKPALFSCANPGVPDRDLGLTIGAGYVGAWSGMGATSDQTNQTAPPNAKINDGIWHEVTMTSSFANGTKVYVDTVVTGNTMSMAQNPTGNPMYIASQNANGTSSQSGTFGNAGGYGSEVFANVDISIILVYARELSAVEMTSNYNVFATRFSRSKK
jgi:hypothetical protein